MESLLLTPSLLSRPPRFTRYINAVAVPQRLCRLSPPRHCSLPFSPLAMAASTPQSSQVAAAAAGDVNGSADAFQLIRAHQDTAARLSPIEEIRTVVEHSIRGMLCTLSQVHEGYPSGSLVDFACNHDGSPILAVSSLAVHSKVPDDDRDAVRSVYLKKHPDAFWVDFGDFHFIYIKPKFVRYVSGVATALLGSGEFRAEEYEVAAVDPISYFSNPIMSHMNRDHGEDTKAIVQHSISVKVDFASMIGVDSLGFNVKAGYQGKTLKLRIPFPRRAHDRKDVKTLIVEMLQAAKASSEI